MKKFLLLLLLATALTSNAASDNPIRIDAPELTKLNFEVSTGGLPVAPGLESYVVIRADKEHPENADGRGWTYQHHPDMAAWHGRLYVGWNSCERDEDVWPSRELISSSTDGKTWSKPAEMFPQGISTPLRMYFFRAPNGRMLVIAGLRVSEEKLAERKKGGIVVRELRPDHSLGAVFTLRPPPTDPPAIQPPRFATAKDPGFVKACEQLLADHVFLLQQDYGNLLDPAQRMKWNDPTNWVGDEALKKEAAEFGKAVCFFERKDGAIVAVMKRRWVTVSRDHGKTWSQPVRPDSLITGMGKVWGQKTSDGRYALIYNPDASRRWPVAMLTSDDGITFRQPYALHGDIPPKRFEGSGKSPGISYMRGLSEWNNDGTWKDKALWMAYSVNKEEIRVIRVPLPNSNPKP